MYAGGTAITSNADQWLRSREVKNVRRILNVLIPTM